MRGILIHYNFESHQGLIRAEDGRRYAFHGQEWRSNRKPVTGDDIDFEVQGTVAYDIYVIKPAVAPVDLSSTVSQLSGSVTQGARNLTSSDLGRRLSSWTVIIAIVTLLGCFMPFISFGGNQASLFGIGTEVGHAVDGLTQMEALGRMMNTPATGFGRPQQPQAQRSVDLSGLRWSLRVAYLLYLVPIATVAVICFALLNRKTGVAGLWQGLSALVLPILIPLLMSLAIYAQIPSELKQVLNGGGIDVSFLGLGFWVLVLSGLAQMLNRFGVFKKQPWELVGRPT